MENNDIIPKTIHYCWFGKGKKSKLFYKCYKSWEKYFPDYKIIEWNEKNFDINCNDYVKEAYIAKKYAFVSDYARLKILYDNGGIYFDTDVEVLRKFDNSILRNGYLAKECDDLINTGLGFAVSPQNEVIKIMMEDYKNIHFIDEKGVMDITPCPVRNSKSLIQRGYEINKDNPPLGKIQTYGKDYFCGYDVSTHQYAIKDITFSVHHYAATWINKRKKLVRLMKKSVSKIIGRNGYEILRKLKFFIKKK